MAKPPLVAIIDDDLSVREAITDLVAICGYAVDVFDSAEAFLETPPALCASCIIVDVRMPGLSGIDLHRRLIADGHVIPTIFITAHPQKAASDWLLKQGASAYLCKPVREEILVDCIRRAVAGQSLQPGI